VFAIYAEAISAINFELAPALFSIGEYLFQFLFLGIQFFQGICFVNTIFDIFHLNA